MNDSQWSIRAVSVGSKHTKIYAGNSSVAAGPQVNLQPSGDRLSALELLLSAWAGDVVEGFRRELERRGREIYGLELSLKAKLGNVLVHLGVVGESGDPGVSSIAATIYLSSDGEKAEVELALGEALARAPVHATLSRATSIDLRVSLL